MFLLFELVMRYVDYNTFVNCSKCNKECRRICNKLISELKRTKKYDNYYESYETFWNNKRQGLCYYINDSYLKIIDFNEDEKIATYYYSYFIEYFEIDERRYSAKMDYQKLRINIPNIPNYCRTYISLKPVENSSYLS